MSANFSDVLNERAKAILSASGPSNDFVAYAKTLAAFRGRKTEMRDYAETHIRSPRLRELMTKTTVAPANISDGDDWASTIAPLSNAFVQSLTAFGAFDRMLPDLVKLPFRTRICLASSGAQAGPVSELGVKPITQIAFGTEILEPVKVVSHLVMSVDLARNTSPQASALIGAEMRKAVANASDKYFVDTISQSTAIQSTSSTGWTAAQFSADLADALANVTIGANSKLYLVVAPDAWKTISLLRDTGGLLLQNGMVGPIRVVPSAGIVDQMLLVDAASVAGASDTVELLSTDEATIRMDDAEEATDSPGALHLSLFQNDLSALRCTRYMAAALLRSDGAAIISSATV